VRSLTWHNEEIVRRVVSGVTVDVMDNFAREQLSPQYLFCDNPMDVPAIQFFIRLSCATAKMRTPQLFFYRLSHTGRIHCFVVFGEMRMPFVSVRIHRSGCLRIKAMRTAKSTVR